MKEFFVSSICNAIIQEGTITKVKVDAIVNAANERMLGGLGVDGAIHLWAGPQLEAACAAIPEQRPDVRCPRGEARITPGFNLPSDYVIHAVGPIYQSHEISSPVLASAYRASLQLANDHGVRSIAFPAISCGAYGYPILEAARVAISTCKLHAGGLQLIRFVLYGSESYECWLSIAKELLTPLNAPNE